MLKIILASSFIPLHYNLQWRVRSCVSVNSCLLSCFPPCLLLSGVRHRSLLHSPNVSQVSLCCSILVNLFDITLGAVTSTLLPAAPATSIVPAMLTCCSMKTHTHFFPSTRIPHNLQINRGQFKEIHFLTHDCLLLWLLKILCILVECGVCLHSTVIHWHHCALS